MFDYLTGRKQQCKVGNHLSESRIVQFGVPQGTMLGPTPFLIYLNDLLFMEKQMGGAIISYADDTALIYEEYSWEGLMHQANVGLKIVN